jgi:transketolase
MPVEREPRWQELARQLRVDCVRATAAAGSGHPTSALSAADLMAVLLDGHLRYDFSDPTNPGNDRLIFSKGHAAPLLYAMFKAAGALSDEELLTLRQPGSPLEGHPTPRLPWVEVATGSLGQGLPIGVGIALAGKRLDKLPYRVWVLCGDGELAEGSMWEAFERAGQDGLDNLVAIVDVNGEGQGGPTMWGTATEELARRVAAFGWDPMEIDGHRPAEIDKAYQEAAARTGRPLAILARTVKGKGVVTVESCRGLHGKPLSDPAVAIRALGGRRPDRLAAVVRPARVAPQMRRRREVRLPGYEVGARVDLRRACGETLVAMGAAWDDLVVLDADVAAATHTRLFAEAHPERFFQSHIAEQQMVATAIGLQARGYVAVAATFAAFLSRAADFIRMAAVSRANLCLVGCYAGLSAGPDGPSQMGLEDLAVVRAVHGSVVLCASDANQTAKLLRRIAGRRGIQYLRVTRAELPVLYDASEQFEVGGSRVLRASNRDDVTIATVGITVHEALRAVELLDGEGIRARVVDLYSIKPLDVAALRAATIATSGRLVVAEDHRPEGGLGEAVLSALAGDVPRLRAVRLAIGTMPGAGTREHLREAAGIDAVGIARAARSLVGDEHEQARSCRDRPVDRD